ncbi:MAG: TlpA disulfide reductase family protein [Conexivisphaerales archaeon]
MIRFKWNQFVILALLLYNINCCYPIPMQSKIAPEKNCYAPDFILPDLQGEKFALSAFRGKKVVLNFWATWCSPCREELTALQRVYEVKRSKNVIIISVHIGGKPQQIVEFVHEVGITFPVLLDTSWEVAAKYRLKAIPCTFWIDERGVIREITLGGPMDEEFIITLLNKLSAK